MIDLHASRLCQVDIVDEALVVTPYTFDAPATIIVGDLWLAMDVGERRIVQAGVVPRVATEADVTSRAAGD